MKKVLILEGSPRIKGNSSILSDEFEKGAVEAGCKVEKKPYYEAKNCRLSAALLQTDETDFPP